MAVQQSKLTPIDVKPFANESIRACLFQVLNGDEMMAEEVKEQPSL